MARKVPLSFEEARVMVPTMTSINKITQYTGGERKLTALQRLVNEFQPRADEASYTKRFRALLQAALDETVRSAINAAR